MISRFRADTAVITLLVIIAVGWISLWQSRQYEDCIHGYQPNNKAAKTDQESLPYFFFVRGRGIGCIDIAVDSNGEGIAALAAWLCGPDYEGGLLIQVDFEKLPIPAEKLGLFPIPVHDTAT